MNLVKWFRKNNKKVMAIVVIVIMVGFVGGTYLQQLISRRRTGRHDTIAYFGDNKKITNYDLALAQQELKILREMLRIDGLLRLQDMRGVLLGELLFSERSTSPAVINHIKQMIRTNEYSISDKQINDIYRRSMPGEIYWYCLKNEPQLAGIRISNEDSRRVLARAIPQLFNGATYSQLLGSIVNRQGIPEEEILTTFGKLLAVLQYAMMICSGENATAAQIMHKVSWEEERIDAEFLRFDSSIFVETQGQPTKERISAHFDKYKKFFAGTVSEQNPYGFGYKQPDRVRLEYIAVKLDDISGTVPAPTPEETEEYYTRHREQFTEQVPSDLNDPNSPLTERIKSYAEVANIISKGLLQNKINSKAQEILQEAKTLTEAGLQETDMGSEILSAEQLKAMSGDYKIAADQLSKKYKIKVYAGQTGLLTANDIRANEHLGRLYIEGYGYNPVTLPRIVFLPQVVFAIDELQASELGPFDVPKPRMYENIGPARDIFGQIRVVVRVIEAQKVSEPESINQTFSKSTLVFEKDPNQTSEDVYSVKEKVTQDLKRLAAMDTAKSKAEEFIDLAAKNGWESTVEKFNELYGQAEKTEQGDPNEFTGEGVREPFNLQNLGNLRRISRETIDTLAVQNAGNPAAQFLVDEAKIERQFIDRLYALVPPDSNTVDTVPLVFEFKPNMSYYCLKQISVKRLERQEYENIKLLRVYKEDVVQYQSLAPVHFNPENILKRMNFRRVREDEDEADANAPAESRETL